MMFQNIKANRLLDKLSLNEMFILSFLYTNKKASPSDLKERINLLKSQINRHLNNLLDKGYITMTQDPDDKRKSNITLTESGVAVYLEEHKKIIAIMNIVTSKLGNKKTEELTEYLIEAVEVLKENEH